MNRHARSRTLLTVFTVIVCITMSVPCITADTDGQKLVVPEELVTMLSKPDLRIIDCRPDIKAYWQSHIPGAVFVHPESLRLTQSGVPVTVLPVGLFVEMLGELGIDKETTVIVYSEKNDYFAPYLLWALDYIGHNSSHMLDGGFERWKKEGHPVTQDYPAIQPATYPPP